MADDVYIDDPSGAVAYLRDKVIGKKLGSGGMEIRPTSLPNGRNYMGMARVMASQRMDLALIPRVAIGPARHGEIPVWVFPRRGVGPDQVATALAQATLNPPPGQVTATSYRLQFPKATSPEDLVSFAQQAIMALGVQPGQGWQWVSRGGDQMPG